MTIYKSKFPLITDLPETSTWHFVFENDKGTPDDKVIYQDGITDRKITYGELRTLTKRMAHGLRNGLGLEKGDRVLIFSSNSILYPALVQSTQAAALVCSLANSGYSASELVHQITDSKPRVLVAGKEVICIAREALKLAKSNAKLYLLEEETADNVKSIWSLMTKDELTPEKISAKDAHKVAFMCYSSGTTGKAKGVESTHYNLTSVIRQVIATEPESYTSEERWLGFLPLYHMYGHFFMSFLAPYVGATVVIIPKFDFALYLSLIQKHKITLGHIVPPIAVLLTKDPRVSKYDLTTIKSWRCGAAPLAAELSNALLDRCKIPILGGYGMTESTCVISMSPMVGENPHGASGLLVPNMEAKLDNGELLVRGPNIMKGYHNNDKANKETFTSDGWMRTGDIVHFDERGNLFVVDRLKELIKYKAFQVPPADLEDLLLQHPSVSDSAVIGIYDKAQATELPRAYVVLAPGTKKDGIEQQIIDWVAAKVSNHKRLRGGVVVLDAVPKSASGKILRRVLRDQAQKEAKTEAKL